MSVSRKYCVSLDVSTVGPAMEINEEEEDEEDKNDNGPGNASICVDEDETGDDVADADVTMACLGRTNASVVDASNNHDNVIDNDDTFHILVRY